MYMAKLNRTEKNKNSTAMSVHKQGIYGHVIFSHCRVQKISIFLLHQVCVQDAIVAEVKVSLKNVITSTVHKCAPLSFLWLGPKQKTFLRLLDLVPFLVIDVLFVSTFISLWSVISLTGNKKSASKKNTKN